MLFFHCGFATYYTYIVRRHKLQNFQQIYLFFLSYPIFLPTKYADLTYL
ncbi:hypothetical protein HMPREF9074_08644 [Capnocytophaga sp. oral taxon 329 str. F0087]|nr:hypothetical protein HMPREF9074_08644 [Capnocytophaga sp. oral taxon 329 str. F0087]